MSNSQKPLPSARKNFRQLSKLDYLPVNMQGDSVSDNQLIIGTLQRIADATEAQTEYHRLFLDKYRLAELEKEKYRYLAAKRLRKIKEQASEIAELYQKLDEAKLQNTQKDGSGGSLEHFKQ